MSPGERAAWSRVARLLATGAPPADVFAAAVAGASAVLGVPTTLRRYAGDGATVVVASSGRSVPGPAPGAVPQAPGGVVAVPVEIATGVWGELGAVLSAACPQDEDGATRRLEPFAQLVAAAVHADDERARLTASAAQEAASQEEARQALAASRTRVVAAADESRRRLQRDVHDGAQQRLVYALLVLTMARDCLETGSAAAGLVDDALDHVQRANQELRAVARRIMPRSLTHGGLRSGVESLVAELPLPVDVRVTAPRLPPLVETTGYVVVAEALRNAVAHARARGVRVLIELQGDALVVEVSDDGDGGAAPGPEGGLTGLADRVSAVGGVLTLRSPAGGGTTVLAELPVRLPG